MEDAKKLINQPVTFRHNGNINYSIGVIKGISEARNETIIAEVQLEKSAKKSGFFSKLWKKFTGDDGRVKIPINLLHILTDVKSVQRNTPKDEYTGYAGPSTEKPIMVRVRGDNYITKSFLGLEDDDKNLKPGSDVIWNKYPVQEKNPIGTVAYFAYCTDVLGEKTDRVCVDFVDQLKPFRDFNYEYVSRVLCTEKGILFRYCILLEEIIGLEEYLMIFQSPSQTFEATEGENPKHDKKCDDTLPETKSENGDNSKIVQKNSQPDYSFHTKDKGEDNAWKTVTYGKGRGNSNITENSNYSNYRGIGTYSTKHQRKNFFAICCALLNSRCDLKQEDIPTGCAVVYRLGDPEPILGKTLWIGNVRLKDYPYLEEEIYVEVQFESSVEDGSGHKNVHADFCCSYNCRKNSLLLISLDDLKDEAVFKILNPTGYKDEDEETPQISKEYFTEMPPPCHFDTIASVRLDSTESFHIMTKIRYEDKWGFQGCNNSCYADTTLFTIFAFTDVFDSILNANYQLKDEACAADDEKESIRKETVHILKQYIIGPIRKDFYVPKENVARLRCEMAKVNPEFKNSHMDAEDFMLCLFETILGVPGFFQYDKDYSDYIHQIMLSQFEEKPTFKVVNFLQQMINESFQTSQVQLENVPHPGFVIKLPVCGGKLMNCKYVLPELKLDLGPILKNRNHDRTSMDLLSVICLRDNHFTCFVKIGTNWCFYDSNPTERKPKVVRVPNLTETLEELRIKISQHNEFKLERHLENSKDKLMLHLMSFAYIYFYV